MRSTSSLRAWGSFLALAALCGCVRVVTPPPRNDAADAGPCGGTRRTDEFMTSGSTSLDVLVVVDDSAASAEVLPAVEYQLIQLFAFLAERADFHIALAATSDQGTLVPVPAIDGASPCDGCAYLSRSMCRDADPASNTPFCANLAPFARSMAHSLSVKTPHPAAGMVLRTVARSLGIFPQAGEITPHVDPPARNAGFYRPEAGLMIFVVTGMDDPDVNPDDTASYANKLRILRNLKGLGLEDNIVFATVTAAPKEVLHQLAADAATACGLTPAPLSDFPAGFCREMHRLMNRCMASSLQATDKVQCMAGTLKEMSAEMSLSNPTDVGGCNRMATIPVGNGTMQMQVSASPAPNLLGLSCDMDGVIYNACADDWTGLLRGRISEFLERQNTFPLDRTPTAVRSSVTGCPNAHGSLCIELTTSEGRSTFVADAGVSTDGGVPVLEMAGLLPGTRVRVSYDVADGDTHCCLEGCAEDEFCNATGNCQAASCRGLAACPTGALCDAVTGDCVSANACTRDEHCPFGQRCDCTGHTCVDAPDGGGMLPGIGGSR